MNGYTDTHTHQRQAASHWVFCIWATHTQTHSVRALACIQLALDMLYVSKAINMFERKKREEKNRKSIKWQQTNVYAKEKLKKTTTLRTNISTYNSRRNERNLVDFNVPQMRLNNRNQRFRLRQNKQKKENCSSLNISTIVRAVPACDFDSVIFLKSFFLFVFFFQLFFCFVGFCC